MTAPGGPSLTRLGLAELLIGYRTGAFTPADVLDACLQQVTALNPRLRALTQVAPSPAPAYDPALPLSGVPFVVKDLVDVAGQVTRAGSGVTADAPPAAHDAAVVTTLRAAGAFPYARSATHEFAWGITTRHPDGSGAVNPHDASRVAGGSSGGSAVAVATGMAPFAVGTDTGGSIRIPAAWCGVAGWKPSAGLLPADGVVPLAPSLDVVGFLARSVADLLVLARLLAPAPPPSRSLRLGVPAAFVPEPSEALARCLASTRERAADAGVEVVELPPFDGTHWYDVYRPIQMSEALVVHRDLVRTWPAQAHRYGADVAARLRSAETVTAEQVAWARAERARLTLVPAEVDALLLPVSGCGPSTTQQPDLAPGSDRPLRDLVMPFTVPANLTGGAAVAVPAGVDDVGLPVGVQVVARRGDDLVALELARRVSAGEVPGP